MEGWTDGRTEAQTDGWMDGWVDGRLLSGSLGVWVKSVRCQQSDEWP